MNQLLVIEDSELARKLIITILEDLLPGWNISYATDPFEAREMIAHKRPDLVLLDLELPRMTGDEFLRHLMKSHPLPVIVVSGVTEKDAGRKQAMVEAGALAVIAKPRAAEPRDAFKERLAEAIRLTLPVDCGKLLPSPTPLASVDAEEQGEVPDEPSPRQTGRRKGQSSWIGVSRCMLRGASHHDNPISLIAIGASTGGPQALGNVLRPLPVDSPPVIVAQHMSERFIDSLVVGLNKSCACEVVIGEQDAPIEHGKIYFAPPMGHIRVDTAGRIDIKAVSKDCKIAPSVDELFHSLVAVRPRSTLAIILTGMGSDGAEGMLELNRAGAATIAQDERTCAVFGMPKQAILAGGVDEILSLDEIGNNLVSRLDAMKANSLTKSGESHE